MKRTPCFLILAIATVIALGGCGKSVETVCKKINDVSKTKPMLECSGRATMSEAVKQKAVVLPWLETICKSVKAQ